MSAPTRRLPLCLSLRLGGVLAALCLGQAALAADWRVGLIDQRNNPALARTQLDRAYLGHPGGPAREALAVALEEAAFELGAAQTKLVLKEDLAGDAREAVSQAVAAEKAGARMLVLNLPAPWVVQVAAAVKLPLLNIGATDDALRERDCQTHLFHVAPSDRMLADALAQALVARKWTQVLLLAGAAPADAQRTAVARGALQRYGLKVVEQRSFKLSADPRERAQANLALLTGGASYDVVWVVDSQGEFARSLPYNTQLPRPVVGDGGLVPLAWHAQFERYGAPQVARRFMRSAKRPMTAPDWAAWMAGRVVTAAALAKPQPAAGQWRPWLVAADLDGSKGTALQFRAWDGQLRQPIVLTDGQGVVGLQPGDGVLHRRNVLDTLGADEPENLCKPKP